jgi:rod shape-determining protein MreC
VAKSRQTNQRITLVMLVLTSITVITLDYRGEASRAIGHIRDGFAAALSPLQRGVAFVLHPIGDTVSSAFHYGQLQSENNQLQKELGLAREQLAGQGYANLSRTRELFTLASLPFAPSVPRVAAEVISQASSNFAPGFEIDRGSSSGVGPGMPVVANGGLVGTVVAPVSATTAWVQLLTSSGSSIGVEDRTTGKIYVASGGGPDASLRISETSDPPRPGAELVTSGEDAGAYPPAIPVATVKSVAAAPGGISSDATLAPLVDPANLQYVAVLQWLQPA